VTEHFHAPVAAKKGVPADVRFAVERFRALGRSRAAAAMTGVRCVKAALREPAADRNGVAPRFAMALRCGKAGRSVAVIPFVKALHYGMVIQRFCLVRTLSGESHSLPALGCCVLGRGVLPAPEQGFVRRFDIPLNATACQYE
jgi:hypothetical protein